MIEPNPNCPKCGGSGEYQEGTGHGNSEGGEDWRMVDCELCFPEGETMGTKFEIWTWLSTGAKDGYDWEEVWSGEEEDLAFQILRNLKESGQHPCVKLIWR